MTTLLLIFGPIIGILVGLWLIFGIGWAILIFNLILAPSNLTDLPLNKEHWKNPKDNKRKVMGFAIIAISIFILFRFV